MVGAYSGRENTLTVVDVDPRFIAEIDPLSTIFCRTWETPFLYGDPPPGPLFTTNIIIHDLSHLQSFHTLLLQSSFHTIPACCCKLLLVIKYAS